MTKILLIEDEPQTRANLALILRMEGFTAVTASNGRLGLEAVARERPDLILCDVSMPELDGFGVLNALRANPETASIPFIFLTARGERQDQRSGMNSGADDYIVKPAEPDDLLAAVRARLSRLQQTTDAVLRSTESDADIDFASPIPLEGLGLTPREAEVLLWVAQGKANADVATILGMSDKTVKIHLAHIYEKLSVETRTAAALLAVEKLPRQKRPLAGPQLNS